MTRKAMIPLFLLLLFLVPVAQCFTIDNQNFNFVGSNGGNITYGFAFTCSSLDLASNFVRLQGFTYNGKLIGLLSLDSTGNITVTDVTNKQVTYTVSSTGVETQNLIFREFAEPASVTGETSYTYNGNYLIIRTSGAATVIVNYSESTALAYMSFYFFALLGLGLVVANGYALINGLVDFKFTIIFMTSYVIGAIILGFMLSMNI